MVYELFDLILVGLFGFAVGGLVTLLYLTGKQEKKDEEIPPEPFDE